MRTYSWPLQLSFLAELPIHVADCFSMPPVLTQQVTPLHSWEVHFDYHKDIPVAVGGLAWMPLGEEKDRTFTHIWRRLSDLGNHEPEGLLPLFPMVFKKSAYTKTKYVLDSVVLLEHKKTEDLF